MHDLWFEEKSLKSIFIIQNKYFILRQGELDNSVTTQTFVFETYKSYKRKSQDAGLKGHVPLLKEAFHCM